MSRQLEKACFFALAALCRTEIEKQYANGPRPPENYGREASFVQNTPYNRGAKAGPMATMTITMLTMLAAIGDRRVGVGDRPARGGAIDVSTMAFGVWTDRGRDRLYGDRLASKRAFCRFKRKFQSEAFNGLGLFRFITYWFAIRRVLREKRSAQ
jgi:hypothetical protein